MPKPQTTPAPTSKRAALSRAGLKPVQLTAYERVKFASVQAANDNGKSREARRAI